MRKMIHEHLNISNKKPQTTGHYNKFQREVGLIRLSSKYRNVRKCSRKVMFTLALQTLTFSKGRKVALTMKENNPPSLIIAQPELVTPAPWRMWLTCILYLPYQILLSLRSLHAGSINNKQISRSISNKVCSRRAEVTSVQ